MKEILSLSQSQVFSDKMGMNIMIDRIVKSFIDEGQHLLPLGELARNMKCSEEEMQRLFKEWSGVCLEDFFCPLTVSALKHELRAHDHQNYAKGLLSRITLNIHSIVAGEVKQIDNITYGYAMSPFGEVFVATKTEGICLLVFAERHSSYPLERLRAEWPDAYYRHQDKVAQEVIDLLFKRDQGVIDICLQGTPFSLSVWEGLLQIPYGRVMSYAQLAQSIGMPKSTRAVASAVGRNPVSIIVPCHRIVRSEGVIGNYLGGTIRKTALIGWEKARQKTVNIY